MPRTATCLFCTLFVLSSLLLGGCDNTLAPRSEETGSLSVYGFLTVSDDKHFVRVRDLDRPVIDDTTGELDVDVRLQNLATGNVEVLQDSVVEFDGIYTHNFWVEKDIQPKSQYRLTVEGDAGEYVQATATLPTQTDVKVTPKAPRCTDPISVAFPNIEDVTRIRASAGFQWDNEWYWTRLSMPSPSQDIVTSFRPEISENDDEGVIESLIVDPIPDEVDNHCSILDDGTFYIAYTHLGPNWPAQTPIADPLEAETVDDGIGAFGGMHRDTVSVPVDIVELED